MVETQKSIVLGWQSFNKILNRNLFFKKKVFFPKKRLKNFFLFQITVFLIFFFKENIFLKYKLFPPKSFSNIKVLLSLKC